MIRSTILIGAVLASASASAGLTECYMGEGCDGLKEYATMKTVETVVVHNMIDTPQGKLAYYAGKHAMRYAKKKYEARQEAEQCPEFMDNATQAAIMACAAAEYAAENWEDLTTE